MMHEPIFLKNISLSFPQKTCFEGLTTQINPRSRIAIIGHNGSGKSTLLKILQGLIEPTEGEVIATTDIVFGYVPQAIEGLDNLSGAEKLNTAFTEALALEPNVLLLDEPTNHLDLRNRRSIMRMLQNYSGSLILVSHDSELLRTCIDTIWHIDHGRVYIFSGGYDDYLHHRHKQLENLSAKLAKLKTDKKQTHLNLMFEQERAKKRKLYGEKKYDGDKLALRGAQGRGELTSNKNRRRINNEKEQVLAQLQNIHLPEIIKPKFHIIAEGASLKTIIAVKDGSFGYDEQLIWKHINFNLRSQERIAITGDNGSGKTTFIKAILGNARIIKTGDWLVPRRDEIGYLDQHYKTIDPNKTPLESIKTTVPTWTDTEIRKHLNDFLFRKNEEVNAKISSLSGGEKARLSLAQIAAKTPKLLFLDEITNNLDLETKDHVIEVLKEYQGAMIVISHDVDFLKAIGITSSFSIGKKI